MAHFLFNFSEPDEPDISALREQVTARLRLNMWGVDANEPERDHLAPGDRILLYVAEPERAFVGKAELVSGVREWTTSEARAYRGESRWGVLLSVIEEWDPLPMDAVLPRIDPDGSNPYVQANARDGFRKGFVRISAAEYETVLAVRAEQLARIEDR